MLTMILQGLVDFATFIINSVFSLLPSSPFLFSLSVPPWAKWIGIFIPFASIFTVAGTYVTAVGSYYLLRIALRWVKAVGS